MAHPHALRPQKLDIQRFLVRKRFYEKRVAA